MHSKLLPYLLGGSLVIGALSSCQDDEPTSQLSVPATYTFVRDGVSTVNFTGQTERIQMATEFTSALKDFGPSSLLSDEARILEMYRNAKEDGSDADPFANPVLNASTKKVNNKVAVSTDYFSDNAVETNFYRSLLEEHALKQARDIYPTRNQAASLGIPGQINDAGTPRYVNAVGVEYDQIVEKAMIGALMTDQMLNHYLSPAVLDENDNRIANDAGTVESGTSYTTMEHKWDEAYGYLFGNATDTEDPLAELGSSDNFINKYLARVDQDSDFAGIGREIFDAFKRGRAAIVAGEYDERDRQATIIRDAVSEVIGVRAVYYMMAGAEEINKGNRIASLHDLSEGLGFIYSLRFTRNTATGQSHFTTAEIETMISQLTTDGGLWTISPAELQEIADSISVRFDFTSAMTID